MRKTILMVICLCTLIVPISSTTFLHTAHAAPQAKPTPSYAKWSRIAIKETKKRYPMGQVTDFLYLGKAKENGDKVERFKLIVRDRGKELGVLVYVHVDPKTDTLKNIAFMETRP
ncbi:DUF3889 domain-containing protein [Priestia koreensis]|uniref:DUF3889 domain-containing protein n=1 Tax=Priestia koreensis TaxID=284581 RepID=UPI0028F6CC51|nr:DUF3889 domain-containing protein [Priestia koreensis]